MGSKMKFFKDLLLATLCALGAAALYGWLVVPGLIMTTMAVVPFLLLSIVAFAYIRETSSQKAASLVYLVGLFPFLLWIVSIILIFKNMPGLNDEIATVLLMSYLSAAAGAYLYLIWPKRQNAKDGAETSGNAG